VSARGDRLLEGDELLEAILLEAGGCCARCWLPLDADLRRRFILVASPPGSPAPPWKCPLCGSFTTIDVTAAILRVVKELP
jgi:hypothetical protein